MRDSAFPASRFFPTFDEVPNAFNREKLSKRRRGVHTVPPDNRVLPECIINKERLKGCCEKEFFLGKDKN
jgi:hypothetical protein